MTDRQAPTRAAGRNWWRILHVVLSALGALFLVLTLFSAVASLTGWTPFESSSALWVMAVLALVFLLLGALTKKKGARR